MIERTRFDGLPVEFAEILRRIDASVTAREPAEKMTTRIVAVDGLGGAGKSTFTENLAAALGGCQIVHTDDFASWENPVDWWPRLIEEVLEPISRNEVARFMRSRWQEGVDLGSVEVRPAERLVLEGVPASRREFQPYLMYAVWIDTPAELRLARGLARDGGSSREQWERWMAAEDLYRVRERPDERADLVLSGEHLAELRDRVVERDHRFLGDVLAVCRQRCAEIFADPNVIDD